MKKVKRTMMSEARRLEIEADEHLTEHEFAELWLMAKGASGDVPVDPDTLMVLLVAYERFVRRQSRTTRGGIVQRGGVVWADTLKAVEAETGLGAEAFRRWLVELGVAEIVPNGRSSRLKLDPSAFLVDGRDEIKLVAVAGFFPGALTVDGQALLIEHLKAGTKPKVVRG